MRHEVLLWRGRHGFGGTACYASTVSGASCCASLESDTQTACRSYRKPARKYLHQAKRLQLAELWAGCNWSYRRALALPREVRRTLVCRAPLPLVPDLR